MVFLEFLDENDVRYGGIRSIFSERSVCPNHVFIKKIGRNALRLDSCSWT